MTTIQKCKWCGKKLPQKKGPGRPRKYCSNKCKYRAYNERQRQICLNIPQDKMINNPKYKMEDYNNYFKDTEFHQNDNNWGLGESNLTEHPTKRKEHEAYYVKKELKRIFHRKPNT